MAAVPQPASRRGRSGAARATAPAARATPPRAVGRPHLLLVAPSPRPRPVGRYLAAGLVLAALGIFGVVGLGALAAESTFDARRLEGEVEALSLRYDELTAEVAALESPAHVREVAQSELGMVPAEDPTYLVAPEVAGEEGPAPDRPLLAGAITDPVKRARDGVARATGQPAPGDAAPGDAG